MYQRKGGIVADGANVAEVVGQSLKFGHQRTQVMRAWWRFYADCSLYGASKRHAKGDRAIAGGSPGEPGGVFEVGSIHQAVNTLCTYPSSSRRTMVSPLAVKRK
jgi:hypothetical protein